MLPVTTSELVAVRSETVMPPYAVIWFVVIAPLLVMICNVAVVEPPLPVICWPFTIRFVVETVVAAMYVEVTLLKRPVVAIKFVNVPVVAMTEPAETRFEKKLVEVALENVPFVAKMFVVVAVPRMAFQRSAEEPSERDASRDGIKFVEIFPLTAKFVVVTFVPVPLIQVRFVRFNVPAERLVNAPFVAKRLVEVTEVPVASVKVRPFNEEMPETERAPREPTVAVTEVAFTAPIARFDPVALRKVRS